MLEGSTTSAASYRCETASRVAAAPRAVGCQLLAFSKTTGGYKVVGRALCAYPGQAMACPTNGFAQRGFAANTSRKHQWCGRVRDDCSFWFCPAQGRVEKAPARRVFSQGPRLLTEAFRGPKALEDRRRKPIVRPTLNPSAFQAVSFQRVLSFDRHRSGSTCFQSAARPNGSVATLEDRVGKRPQPTTTAEGGTPFRRLSAAT